MNIIEITAPDAANVFGINLRSFKHILATEEVPHTQHGGKGKYWKFDLAVLNRWWLERELQKSPNNAGRMFSLNAAREAKLDAEAQMAQLELGKMQRELVPVSAVEPMLIRTFVAVRGRLLAIPAKAAPVIRPDDPKMARECLDTMIREVLEELSVEAITFDIPDEVADEPPDVADEVPDKARGAPKTRGNDQWDSSDISAAAAEAEPV